MKSQGLQMFLKVSYVVIDSWDIYGCVGVMVYCVEFDVSGYNCFEIGVCLFVVVGMEYVFNKNLVGCLEY